MKMENLSFKRASYFNYLASILTYNNDVKIEVDTRFITIFNYILFKFLFLKHNWSKLIVIFLLLFFSIIEVDTFFLCAINTYCVI